MNACRSCRVFEARRRLQKQSETPSCLEDSARPTKQSHEASMFRAALALLCMTLAASHVAAQGLERLKFNNPGLVVDLGVGLWAWPLPMDFDGDGKLDLV